MLLVQNTPGIAEAVPSTASPGEFTLASCSATDPKAVRERHAVLLLHLNHRFIDSMQQWTILSVLTRVLNHISTTWTDRGHQNLRAGTRHCW